MDLNFRDHTLRITVLANETIGSFRGRWAVYAGSPEGGHDVLFEDVTDAFPAFAPAEREAKAKALCWVADLPLQ